MQHRFAVRPRAWIVVAGVVALLAAQTSAKKKSGKELQASFDAHKGWSVAPGATAKMLADVQMRYVALMSALCMHQHFVADDIAACQFLKCTWRTSH